MIEFTTEDTFEIEGRGTVHTGHLPMGVIPTDIKAGDEVLLDGVLTKIRGVEMAATIWSEERRRYGPHPAGLLV